MARQLLWLIRGDSKRVIERKDDTKWQVKLAQQHALCTYKDPDEPDTKRFKDALDILQKAGLGDLHDPNAIIGQETLGIAGAIYKAQWEASGQHKYLNRSLECYQRAWKQGFEPDGAWKQRVKKNPDGKEELIPGDDGYTGINAAYLLDLIAFQEQREAVEMGAVSGAVQLRQEARRIRASIIDNLPPILDYVRRLPPDTEGDPEENEEARKDWLYWIRVTLGEAYAGLRLEPENAGAFDEAVKHYSEGRALNRYDWMVESSARQLASLMRLQSAASNGKSDRDYKPDSNERAIMEALVGDSAPGVNSAFIGKFGLALSGGGFRASLFHIGVLARLAELDMLRSVECLSCVSGGSIIGAYYVLELRRLLESKTDREIERADYVEIVQRMEVQFLEGVQQNLRMLAISDPQSNLRHNPLSGVLPTERVAELYEQLLYSRIGPKLKEDAAGLFVEDLKILPVIVGENSKRIKDENFRPKDHNWQRENKIPIVVLNATTLNTGHNWQFTASWMGEPPATVNNEVDGNQRLRRMYYPQAPDPYKKVRLGVAVGASACVPALFTPVAFPGLYQDVNLQLVDGGVHDNQGVASLLDQGCTLILVSDGSGQLGDEIDPGLMVPMIAYRADLIAQERVRVSQYQELRARLDSGLLRSLMFVHLKKDLDVPPKDWIGCRLKHEFSEAAKARADTGFLTPYRIHRDVQQKISKIRTDLDAFHNVEAWALMTSGYNMTECLLPNMPLSVTTAGQKKELSAGASWNFLAIAPRLAEDPPDPKLLGLLDASSKVLFKIWNPFEDLKAVVALWRKYALGALLILVVALGFISLPAAVAVIALAALAWVLGKRVLQWGWLRAAVARKSATEAQYYLREKNQQYLDSGKS
jgi:predicted acylesterase/phospholipase RssA